MDRVRARRRPMAEINVVPYIDVMLVLLVIFMITAPLLNLGVEVELPKADAEPMDTQENDEPLIITVLKNGDLYLNAGGDLDGTSSGLIDPESLLTMVTAIVSRNPEIQVLVGGDELATYGQVYSVMVLRLRAFSLAIGVHVLMAAMVVLGTMSWEPFRKPQNIGMTIEAVIVDTSEIKKQREAARQAVEMEDRRRQRDERLEQQKKREQEQKKIRDQEAAEKRAKELKAQKKRDAQDRLQKLRLERERKLEDQRLKQQRELEQVRAQREAAEKQRKLDEDRLRQTEARKEKAIQEQQRLQREAIAQRQADAEAREFRAGQMATKSDNYHAAIQSFVTQNWMRPPTAQSGLRCTLKIVQIPCGEVISAAISGKCNGDEATRRSILAAVERGGALPYRGFEDVFQREIDFNFIYDGD